jgi:hypothetical protein
MGENNRVKGQKSEVGTGNRLLRARLFSKIHIPKSAIRVPKSAICNGIRRLGWGGGA